MSKQSPHDIPDDTLNSALEFCIDEYVRDVRDREILRDHWFHGQTIEAIAAAHKLSSTTVKDVLYHTGDKIILRASSENSNLFSLLMGFLKRLFSGHR